MTTTFFMDLPTARDIERIYLVTDRLHLHRDWVVVSPGWAEQPGELVQPDGKILLRPPGGDLFEPWLGGLAARLSAIDHFRTVRRRYLEQHAGLNLV
jgi:hypothetical protein